MPLYRITVTQLVPDEELRHADREDNPAGTYSFGGSSEADALDQFHSRVPIACVDDFEVSAELITD
jgi:hypothetical protein